MIHEETIRHSSSRKNAPRKNASRKNVPLKISPWKTGLGKIVSQENWPPANCTLEKFPRKISPSSPWIFFWIFYFYENFRLSKFYQFLFLVINNNFFILYFSIIFFVCTYFWFSAITLQLMFIIHRCVTNDTAQRYLTFNCREAFLTLCHSHST